MEPDPAALEVPAVAVAVEEDEDPEPAAEPFVVAAEDPEPAVLLEAFVVAVAVEEASPVATEVPDDDEEMLTVDAGCS